MPIIRLMWKIEEFFITITLAIMSIVTFGAVVSRFSFRFPLPWSEELVRYLFAWTILVGSSIAVRKGAHIGINVVVDRLPVSWRKYANMLAILIAICFCVFLFFIGYDQMMSQRDQYSPAMEVNMALVYACLPVGAILMIISFIAVLWQDLGKSNIVPSDDVEVREVI